MREINDKVKAKDWDAVIKEGTAIRDLYPDYVEAGSVYEVLAQAYTAKKQTPQGDGAVEALREDRREESGYAQATRGPGGGSRG